MNNQLYQNYGSKIEFYGSEISEDNISAPPQKDERKFLFLVTLPGVKKRLSLVPNILITLTATGTKHSLLIGLE